MLILNYTKTFNKDYIKTKFQNFLLTFYILHLTIYISQYNFKYILLVDIIKIYKLFMTIILKILNLNVDKKSLLKQQI